MNPSTDGLEFFTAQANKDHTREAAEEFMHGLEALLEKIRQLALR